MGAGLSCADRGLAPHLLNILPSAGAGDARLDGAGSPKGARRAAGEGGWPGSRFPSRRLKVSEEERARVMGCPEGHGCALRGPGGRRRPCARVPAGLGPRGPGCHSVGPRRDSGRHARGRGRGRPPARVRGAGRGACAAGGRRPAHSPSLAFFFLASVPPSLPRNDSSFFILWGRRAGERGGAEDMGRAGSPAAGRGRSACGSRPGRRRRSPRGVAGRARPRRRPPPRARPWPCGARRQRSAPSRALRSPLPCRGPSAVPTVRVTLTLRVKRWFRSQVPPPGRTEGSLCLLLFYTFEPWAQPPPGGQRGSQGHHLCAADVHQITAQIGHFTR